MSQPRLAFAAFLLAWQACASVSSPLRPSQPSLSGWLGCYVIEADQPAPPFVAPFVDSLELVSDSPRMDHQNTGFRRAFYWDTSGVIEFGDTLFTGPAWAVHGDTLLIWEGSFSGWHVKAVHSGQDLVGVLTTFTDCCSPPFYHQYSAAVRRASCADAKRSGRGGAA